MTSHHGRVPLLVSAGFVLLPERHPSITPRGLPNPSASSERDREAFSLGRGIGSPFPPVPSPSPVSIAAFSCLCTWAAWRMGEHRSFSPGYHISVAGTNDWVSAQCKRNLASFISGGKQSQSSGSVPRQEKVQAVPIPAPSPPFSEMFKLTR